MRKMNPRPRENIPIIFSSMKHFDENTTCATRQMMIPTP